MMNSNDQNFDADLIDYLYGELSSKDQKSFEERLGRDQDLKNELSQFEDTLKTVRKMDNLQEKMPAELSAKILAIAKEKAKEYQKGKLHVVAKDLAKPSRPSFVDRVSRSFHFILRPSFAFVTTLFLVAGLVFYINQERNKEHPPFSCQSPKRKP